MPAVMHIRADSVGYKPGESKSNYTTGFASPEELERQDAMLTDEHTVMGRRCLSDNDRLQS